MAERFRKELGFRQLTLQPRCSPRELIWQSFGGVGMKSESPNNPISPDRHPNLHGNPNAAPLCIEPHPAGTKVRPAEGIARCDDSLPYGLPPRPNKQTP